MDMRTPNHDEQTIHSTNVVVFIAAMVVGVMAYSGDLAYTPLVLLLVVLAVGIDKYGQ